MKDNPEPSTLLCFADRTQQDGKLHIIEVGDIPMGNRPFQKKTVAFNFPPGVLNDFPEAMQVYAKYDCIYFITTESILLTAPHEVTGGIVCVNRSGQVLSVSVDEDNICQYVSTVLHEPRLAQRMAAKISLPILPYVQGGTAASRNISMAHMAHNNERYADALVYAQAHHLKPQYLRLIRKLLRSAPSKAVVLASVIVSATESPVAIDIDDIIAEFKESGRNDECAEFLINALK